MTDIEFAKRWAETRTTDLDAHRELYAASRHFAIDCRKVEDHELDTITTDDEFAEGMARYVNSDETNGRGVHKFTVTDAFPGNGHLFVHFDWELRGADSYCGLPTNGKTLRTKGSAFLDFDANGKIEMESSFLTEPPVFQDLGVPIITPHYWEEGFDPASLG